MDALFQINKLEELAIIELNNGNEEMANHFLKKARKIEADLNKRSMAVWNASMRVFIPSFVRSIPNSREVAL